MGFRRNHSRVDELPREIREQVERMLLEGDNTYDDIKAWLDERGYDISRSSIGRHGQKYFNAYKQLRIMEDQAQTLKSDVGDGMALEEATSKMMLQQVLSALMDESLDVMEMPRIISDIAKLQQSTVSREKFKKEIEEEIRKRTLAEAAERVEETAQAQGMDEDQVRFWREKVLGMR